MSVARFAFGPRLKAHRERRGITLQDIAESTKISAALLSALERNDVSQWPKGVFRRAFLRSYTEAIDVPFEPTWAEFSQLFPEDGSAPTLSQLGGPPQLRLTLAPSAPRLLRPSRTSVIATTLDVCGLALAGLLIATLFNVSVWSSLACTSLLYIAVTTLFVGGSISQRYLRGLRAAPIASREAATPAPAPPQASGDERSIPRPSIATTDDDAVMVPPPAARPRIVAVSSGSRRQQK
jgi:transcriptional regulator with XRE-family HTH domain